MAMRRWALEVGVATGGGKRGDDEEECAWIGESGGITGTGRLDSGWGCDCGGSMKS